MIHNLLFHIFFIAWIFLFNARMNSQVSEAWVSSWNNATHNQLDEPYDIAVDASGNVYVAGSTESWSAYASTYVPDFVTIKYNSSGAEQWVKTYNGTYDFYDEAFSIAVDAQGNVYVTGRSYGTDGYYDYLTIKYDANGNEKWVSRYEGPDGTTDDEANDIAVDASGAVYVTGKSRGSSGSMEFTTIRYDAASGDTVWVKRTVKGGGNVIRTDASGNITAGGYSTVNSIDCFTVQYSPSGEELWTATYDYNGNNDEVYDLVTDAAGNVFVTGYSDPGTGPNKYDFVTIKYTSGAEVWVARYDHSANDDDWAVGIAADQAGSSIYVTGKSKNTSGNYDFATVKYDGSGTEQWVQRYDGTGNGEDKPVSIATDASGNVYVYGNSVRTSYVYDLTTIKYNSSGVQEWMVQWDGPNASGDDQDIAKVMTIDNNGNLYVTGYSEGFDTGNWYDIVTIKYSLGAPGFESTLPAGAGISVYPDPADTYLFYRISGINIFSQNRKFFIKIYNLLGEEISAERLGKISGKIYLEHFPSGVYMYTIEMETETYLSLVTGGKFIVSR